MLNLYMLVYSRLIEKNHAAQYAVSIRETHSNKKFLFVIDCISL
jgi:hypothetical protein